LAIQPSAFPKPRAYVNNCAFSLEYQYRFKDENIDHCFVCRETCLKYLCRLSSDRYNEMSLQVVLQIDIIIFCTAMVFFFFKKKKKEFQIFFKKNTSWPRVQFVHVAIWPHVLNPSGQIQPRGFLDGHVDKIHVARWSRVFIHAANWPRVINTRGQLFLRHRWPRGQ